MCADQGIRRTVPCQFAHDRLHSKSTKPIGYMASSQFVVWRRSADEAGDATAVFFDRLSEAWRQMTEGDYILTVQLSVEVGLGVSLASGLILCCDGVPPANACIIERRFMLDLPAGQKIGIAISFSKGANPPRTHQMWGFRRSQAATAPDAIPVIQGTKFIPH